MKASILINLLLLFCVSLSMAQNPAAILTPNYVYDGNPLSLPIGNPNTTSTADPLNGYFANFKAKSSQNIQVDAQGKILFFIVDGYIFGRSGQYLGQVSLNAVNINGSATYHAQGVVGETMVIPSPGCEGRNTFLLVSTYTNDNGSISIDKRASWDKIVISYDGVDNVIAGSGVYSQTEELGGYLNTPLEDFSLTELIGSDYDFNINNGGDHCNNPLLATSKVIDGTKRYVYMFNSNHIFRFKIENNMLTYDNYFIDISSAYFGFQSQVCFSSRQELEMVTLPNGDMRMAFPISIPASISNPYTYGYATLDFSTSDGQAIPNTFKVFNYSLPGASQIGESSMPITGAELSPDGSKLYLSHKPLANYNGSNMYNNTLDVIDLTTLTRTNLSSISDFQNSQIESAKDGSADILIIPSTSQLHRIANPNGVATVSNYQPLTNYSATNNSVSTHNVRLLQDQIDGEDYSVYGNNIVTLVQFTANASGTWSPGQNPFQNTLNDIYVTESIVIPAGISINVTGMNFYFAPDARLIIESGNVGQQGGRVTITNTNLDAYMDDCQKLRLWRGVEVRGVSSAVQNSFGNSRQGRFIMRNTSSISHAVYGVVANAYNKVLQPSGSYVFTSIPQRTGGMVLASNSKFFNNQTDVYLNSYISNLAPNLSIFENTTFVTSSEFLAYYVPLYYHIQLTGVRGVNIKGCDFVNEEPDYFPTYKGVGVLSVASTFFIDRRCTGFNPNTNCDDPNIFENLTYGTYIYSFNTNQSLPYRIKGNLFKNNSIGVVAYNNLDGSIVENEFQVLRANFQTSGISFTKCNRYNVEANLFTNDPNSVVGISQANTYGVVVANSGIEHNEIYRNTFENLVVGGQSERVNGSLVANVNDPLATGLQWKCNNFKNTRDHDLTVFKGLIDFHQGYVGGFSLANSELRSARNSFSNVAEPMALAHDFFCSNATQELNYVHLADAQQTPDSYSINFGSASYGVLPTQQSFANVPVLNSGNSCPSKMKKLKQINLENYSTNKDSYAATFAKFQELDTLELPYNFSLRDSIKASKDSLKMKELDALLTDASYYLSEASFDKNQIVEELLTDTITPEANNEEYLNLMKENLSPLNFQQLVYENALYNGLDSLAKEILEGQADAFSSEYIAFASDLNILKDADSLLNMIALDSTGAFYSQIEQKMNYTKDERIYAAYEALLNFYLLHVDKYTYSFMVEEKEKSSLIHNDNNVNVGKDDKFLVFPNPTDNNLNIKLIDKSDSYFNIKLVDLTGKVLIEKVLQQTETILDVTSLNGGIYIVQITNQNGELLETKKIIKR
jgi:hypothetical protein